MSSVRQRAGWWCVLVVGGLLLAARAGDVPLLDPDEARFARTSVEMLRSGDLVVPQFEGRPRLAKPPLLHWIQLFVFGLVGASEWAARLHAILATLGSLVLVRLVCRRRFGDEAGVWAAAVLMTMPLVLVPGRVGSLDALLAVHILAVLALDLLEPEGLAGYRALAVGGLLGLAFLVKGPVGVLLPLLIILAGRTAAGGELLPRVSSALQALAAWCLVVLPWGLVFLRRIGLETSTQTLRGEVFDRFFSGTAHVEPAWYYAKVLAVGLLPWVGPLTMGLVRTWRSWGSEESRTARYAAAGLLVGVIFLSLSKGKLPTYILPLAPLAAILVIFDMGQELRSPRERSMGSTLLAATVAASAVLLALAAAVQLQGAVAAVAWVGAGIFATGGLAAFHGAVRRRPRQVYGAAAMSSAAFLLVVVTFLFPLVGRTRSARGLVDAVPELAGARPLVTVEIRVPSLTFYLDRIPEVIDLDRLEARMAASDDPLFVVADVDLPDVPERLAHRWREVGRHGKYRVLENREKRANH